jgi:hypothetical protein
MNCFTHSRTPAVGLCVVCQKGVCHDCVARQAPRLVCRTCSTAAAPAGFGWSGWYGWYGYGYEYKSSTTIAGWPLVHVCSGIDPVTMRLRVARGIVAIGNMAVGVLAIGGVAIGVLAVGGGSIGILMAIGGAALGLGLSVGGFALGSVAIGGAAVGFTYAIGGGAVGPAVIDGMRCDDAAREFTRRWLNMVPPSCR